MSAPIARTEYLTRTEAEILATLILADGSPVCPIVWSGVNGLRTHICRLRSKGCQISHAGPTDGYRLTALPPDGLLDDVLGVLDEWRGGPPRRPLPPPEPRCRNGHPRTAETAMRESRFGHWRCLVCYAATCRRLLERQRELRRARGLRGRYRQQRREVCLRGLHPMAGDNLYESPSGRRRCRVCRRAANQGRDARRREQRRGMRRGVAA